MFLVGLQLQVADQLVDRQLGTRGLEVWAPASWAAGMGRRRAAAACSLRAACAAVRVVSHRPRAGAWGRAGRGLQQGGLGTLAAAG